MSDLIVFRGGGEEIEKLRDLERNLKIGQPILAIDYDHEGNWPLIMTFGGSTVECAGSGDLRDIAVLAESSALILPSDYNHRKEGKANVQLQVRGNVRPIKKLLKQSCSQIKIWDITDRGLVYGINSLVYCPYEIHVVRTRVMTGLSLLLEKYVKNPAPPSEFVRW